ncbi:MAG: ABC transporter ATP-binding protein [Polyangia bacterium]
METAIQAQEVVKRFPEPGGGIRTVLDSVSFECDKGGVLILEGRSGSGKSTLLNVVAGLLTPDSGELLVDGVSVGALSEARRDRFRAQNVGYIFQTFNLISPLTVLENVYVPSSLAGSGQAVDKKRAREVLEELGLGDHLDKLPFHLSVGQRQRVAVARAALRRPKLLLADEPTANLDRESAEIVLATLEKMQSEGSTLLIATHDPVLKQFDGAVSFDLEQGEVDR